MKISPEKLKNFNPKLNQYSDKELEDSISFLNKKGFKWIETEEVFYHEELDFRIKTKGLDLFVENHDPIKNKISEAKERQDNIPLGYNQAVENIKISNFLIKSSLGLGLLNLVFGLFLFDFALWLVIEFILVVLFFSFIRFKGYLLQKTR